MQRKRINRLVERYLQGNCTDEERQMLYFWLTKQAAEEEWEWQPGEEDEVENRLRYHLRDLLETAETEQVVDTPTGFPFRKLAAIAASILVVLSVGIWYFHDSPDSPSELMVSEVQQALRFENHHALVIRADGVDHPIDSMVIGEESIIGQVVVKKLSDNSLSYSRHLESAELPDEPSNHLVVVPKGRDFNVTLPDGSSVWLNTESALEFPTTFAGGERRVAISGEAFFEVVSDKENPFIVMANDMEVTATGTQFNVRAYHDEETHYTTLIEGVVTVTAEEASTHMAPNQQATWQKGGAGIVIGEANIANIMAKKNGYFAFHEQDIKSIMKEISRWYDVEVFFQGEVSGRLFGGTFSRHRELGELLEYFGSIGGFKFKQKGRRIIVMS